MRKPNYLPLVAAVAGLLAGSCDRPPERPPDIRIELGTFKSPLCELENPRTAFALDEPMSMVVSSDRPFGRPGVRYTLYLLRLKNVPGFDQPGREEVDSISLAVNPENSKFCAAGPKLTPRQFGVQEPGRYELSLVIDNDRVAAVAFDITAAKNPG